MSAARELVLQWADDAFVTGHWLSSMTGSYGPDLEENLAVGSFAQDCLGHARALYLTLEPDDRSVDRLVYLRDAAEFRSSALADAWVRNDWAFVVVKSLLCALLEAARCEAVARVASGSWRELATTIARDVEVHVEHWADWLVRLSAAPSGREKVGERVRELWPLLGDAVDTASWRDGGAALWGTALSADAVLSDVVARATPMFAAVRQPGDRALPPLRARASASGGRAGVHTDAFAFALADAQGPFREYPEVVRA